MSKQFGAKVRTPLKERYQTSEHWIEGKFENLVETTMEFSIQNIPNLLYEQFVKTKGRVPKKRLVIEAFDLQAFMAPSQQPKFIWYGHSVLLMRWMNQTILIDPMLGPNASPIAPFATKRFSENALDMIDQFPPIDLALMTHDHYDHLDLASIEKLKDKTAKWYVALGVGRHLESWGITPSTITEFDWWDSAEFNGIQFTFTPSRHFSGRGLSDRAKSLWGGWVMKSNDHNLYWSGDGGYGDHFKEIGEKFRPFDFGFIECGQYNKHWHQIHMYPEEAVQAALDATVKIALPVHWCGFALALHHWKDPIDRFSVEALDKNLKISTPKIGQALTISTKTDQWWNDHE